MSNDKLCKRYLFNLEMIVKGKAAANKKIEGPPRMLYLRELLASMPQIFKELVLDVVRSSPDGCCPPLPRRLPTGQGVILGLGRGDPRSAWTASTRDCAAL